MLYHDWKNMARSQQLANIEAVAQRLGGLARREGDEGPAVGDMRFWVAQAARLVAWPHVDGQWSLPDDVVYSRALEAVHQAARGLGVCFEKEEVGGPDWSAIGRNS